MKNLFLSLLVIATASFTIGCASTNTVSFEPVAAADGKYVAAPEPASASLPAVAAPPASSWGGNSLLY